MTAPPPSRRAAPAPAPVQESSNALDPFLHEAGIALFAVMDVPLASVVQASGPDVEGETVMGVVGFVNDEMSGALSVVASVDVAAGLLPPGLDDAAPLHADLLDAVTEFTNMLLGRIKTLLARRGISVLLSTPTASISEKLRLSPPPTVGARWYAFSTARGAVHARIALRIDPGFSFASRCAPELEPVAEGEMVML